MLQQAFRDRELCQSIMFEQYRHFRNGCTCGQNSRWSWSLPLTYRVWYIINCFTKDTTWIRLLMEESCNAFKILLEMASKIVTISSLLHLDHVLCPAALPVREFLAKHSILVVGSLSALPYLTPMQLLPVAHAEDTLKGKRYKDVAETWLNGTW